MRRIHANRARTIGALALALAAVCALAGSNTFALFTSTALSQGNLFIAGTVDLGALVSGSTPSLLPSAIVFRWTSTEVGTGCSSLLSGGDRRLTGMTPGSYCVARIALRNDHPESIEAWLRLRLVRASPSGAASTDALNDRLKFYMSEYVGGGARSAFDYWQQDCRLPGSSVTPEPTYTPTPTASPTPTPISSPTPTAEGKAPPTSTKVPSTATVTPTIPPTLLADQLLFRPDLSNSTANIPDVIDSLYGSRIALSSLGVSGKNIGRHPGVSAPVDPAISAMAGSGLGLNAGTAVEPRDDSVMTTDPAGRNAFNLVGNDEVTNPKLISNSNTPSGMNPNGTLPEASIARRSTRYYCAAIFFPSDTDLSLPAALTIPFLAGNRAGDNTAQGGHVTYYLVAAAAQQLRRTVQ